MFEKEIEDFNLKISKTNSSLEMARIEREFWETIRSRSKGVGAYNWWLRNKNLPTTAYAMKARKQILVEGAEASILWDKLDSKSITVNAALDIVYESRRTGRSISDLVTEFESSPVLGTGSTGTRRAKKNDVSTSRSRSSYSDKINWADIKNSVASCVLPLFSQLDEVQKISLRKEFEIEMECLLNRFKRKFYGEIKSPRTELRRRQFTEACRELNVSPPRPGVQISKKTRILAKRNYHSLVREYHPDRHGGDESFRSRFEAIVEAWDIFNSFCVQNSENERSV